jgi:ABC-type Na+ efflux pump permease subunit
MSANRAQDATQTFAIGENSCGSKAYQANVPNAQTLPFATTFGRIFDMTPPAMLIAEREFRVYVRTLSFWLALALMPLFMAGVTIITSARPPATPVSVHSANPQLDRSLAKAFAEATRLEGRQLKRVASGARFYVDAEQRDDRTIALRFSSRFPLSALGRALIARTLESDWATNRLAAVGASQAPAAVHESDDVDPPSAPNRGMLSRFATVMILWLTLTGSLGMLLQAAVRERANRSLEGLLAAAQPWEIMVGKLAGVGAVSLLILGVWLGSVGGMSALMSASSGPMPQLLKNFSDPMNLLRVTIIYVLAYSFYGAVTVGLGAAARDVTVAQTFARPMFGILLIVLFVTLSGLWQVYPLWLVYLPPFAPFILLMHEAKDYSFVCQAVSLGLLILLTALAGWLAIGRFTLSGAQIGPWKIRETVSVWVALSGSRVVKT